MSDLVYCRFTNTFLDSSVLALKLIKADAVCSNTPRVAQLNHVFCSFFMLLVHSLMPSDTTGDSWTMVSCSVMKSVWWPKIFQPSAFGISE
jgi:hypothetical protein